MGFAFASESVGGAFDANAHKTKSTATGTGKWLKLEQFAVKPTDEGTRQNFVFSFKEIIIQNK